VVTEQEIPLEIYWCKNCNVPIIKYANAVDRNYCPVCNNTTSYLCSDIRPVFPEERLLLEIIQGKPLSLIKKSVWASDSRYYIDGMSTAVSQASYKKISSKIIREQLEMYASKNNYEEFNIMTERFVVANKTRLEAIVDEACNFIQQTASSYTNENVVVSFSGGKDSTVTANLATRALSDPSLVHIFGNTTLEFPMTLNYTTRFRKDNPKVIFKTALNKEQDFYNVCDDIGPPARMLRWCCSMFKTGPITKMLNRLYSDRDILTFYGIRKCESLSRSRYNRVEDNAETIKIQKQKVASPIFLWKDIDVWLYILSEGVDFNDAYRLGYDRVGCWCCPNNNAKAQFLSNIYMPKETETWHDFLVNFAKRIGKEDAEEYINSGAWKARQGGNGVAAAQDIKIKYTNCTTEDNAKIYRLVKPIDDDFFKLFIPFGIIAPELGRKLINEVIVIDINTNVPILSIQPFSQEGYEYAVKVKTINVAKHEDLHRMVGYQVKKYNACRKCLKCESLCRHRAISIVSGKYHIDDKYCKRCRMCVTSKYLEGGCLMEKYLKTKV